MSVTRVEGEAAARERWGAMAQRVAGSYSVGDPLADEAVASMNGHLELAHRALSVALDGGTVDGPEPLRRFAHEARAPRAWQDDRRCERGAAVLRRWAPWVALVLRCEALPRAYASPIGNKPLALTRRLAQDTKQRLTYTARFVWSTQQTGAMGVDGAGTRACIRVRWTHAVVRDRLLRTGFDPAWGVPMPQPDLAATALLFGVVAIEGLRRLGAEIAEHDADAVAHLYRVVADRVGVSPELQTDTHADGCDRFALLTAMHGPPDADSRTLTDALMSTPVTAAKTGLERAAGHAARWAMRGVAGGLLGPLAPGLGLPRSRRRFAAAGRLLRLLPAPVPAQAQLIERLLR